MERALLFHDVETGLARVRFEHNGVTLEQNYNLKLVVPGSVNIFNEMGIEFDEEHQLKALDKLTEYIEFQIEDGTIKNPPEE